MRNYVIINGVNSLTIQGLAIKTLPPITKPIQRNLREGIDGRDGDIVTTLGYGAYDKTIEIGLFGTFDIDEVIEYFNQKGTITFSNEADKVYYFEALDQVDYVELLKFRTANVVLHCQPFKYPLNETPLEEEYEYVEGEGTELTLNNTANAIFNKFDLLGNTSQTGTPTPSNPIPIHVVSGDNTIDICGKNLFDKNDVIIGKAWNNASNSARAVNFIKVEPNTTYSISTNSLGNLERIYAVAISEIGSQIQGNQLTLVGTTLSGTINTRTNTILAIQMNKNSIATSDFENLDIQLEKGSTATNYEPYIGNSYPIYLGVENLFDYSTNILANANIDNVNNIIKSDNTCKISYVKCQPNTTYTISRRSPMTNRFVVATTNSLPSVNTPILSVLSKNDNTTTSITITTPSNANYIVVRFVYNLSDDYETYAKTIQIEKGTKINHPSTTPIELCKIGTYQDYIYKDNGSWYLHKEIGKVVLNGSERYWGDRPNYTYADRFVYDRIRTFEGTPLGYCDYFIIQSHTSNTYPYVYLNATQAGFNYSAKGTTTLAQFKTWLSTHPVTIYYVMGLSDGTLQPTTTEITDTTLLSQLEAIKNATSYESQTNISQENNDLPFILDLSALKENSDHLVIDNIGNIYSKPTLDLEGTGIVDIYLNDTQMFEVDLSEKYEIVIDTEKMEAYNPTDNTLANRQVTGDYSKFKLDSGENDLRFSGDLTKATITNYERWL